MTDTETGEAFGVIGATTAGLRSSPSRRDVVIDEVVPGDDPRRAGELGDGRITFIEG